MTKVKTLIVEDEIFVARDLQMHLEQMGYSATSIATSGEQAIQEIENEIPDLVLMDIVLQGGIDGIATAEIIRSRFDIPVIFLTAHGDKAIFERAKKTEPLGYIVKPFHGEGLRKTIEVVLFRHKAEQKKDALTRKHRKELNEFLRKHIIKHRRVESMLRKSEEILEKHKESLEQKNIALREVLGQVEIEKQRIIDNVIANAENLLLPTILRLGLAGGSRQHARLLQKNLEELTSSFGAKLADKKSRLTSREIEICNMIKNGLTSKEMAEILNSALLTVEKHRNNIRNKLGITNKKISLFSVLRTL